MKMNDFPPRPSPFLLDVYARLASRYMAPHVRLAGFQSRWIAFRRDDLEQGIEHAVLDTTAGRLTQARQAELMAQAREAAGPGRALVIAEMAVKRATNEEAEGDEAVTSRIMTVALRETGQPSGVLGFVELDNDGCPTGRTGGPMPLLTLDASSD
ncbi:hypothetical protein [Azohydromonas australica]|uniref:hypothetical protein n=1 Tax=Azohydromonas australica TaxID=364039 RepID=UPI000400A95C|nr:hypothetical protein [Azohydromonas australica]